MISRAGVASGLEKVVVRRSTIWAIRRVGYRRSTEALQKLLRQFRRMKFRVVMQKCNFEAFWVFFAYCIDQFLYFSRVDIVIDSLVLLRQLPEQNTFQVPENGEHDLVTV